MADKPTPRQDFSWRLEALAYDVVGALLRLMPLDWVSATGSGLMKLVGPMTAYQTVAMTNLGFAFPEKSEAEKQAILKGVWDNVGRTFAEFVVMDRIAAAGDRIEIVGRERLEAIKTSGKPVIFVSGHFANWEAMMVGLFAAGIQAHVAYRPTNNPYVNKRIVEGRARFGIDLLSPKGKGGRDLMLSLRRGTSIAILIDQKDTSGMDVPFFGRPAPTMVGAARMALHYGLDVQPIAIERLKGARFRLTVYDPITLAPSQDKEADMVAGTERINAFLEDRVRERPEGWFFVHRRWRRRDYPGGDTKKKRKPGLEPEAA